jgi:hypothetical protein
MQLIIIFFVLDRVGVICFLAVDVFVFYRIIFYLQYPLTSFEFLKKSKMVIRIASENYYFIVYYITTPKYSLFNVHNHLPDILIKHRKKWKKMEKKLKKN